MKLENSEIYPRPQEEPKPLPEPYDPDDEWDDEYVD